MKVLSLFSGIGAFESALNRLGKEYELVNYCEIDKYASKGYAAIHNVPESLNLGDITKVDTSTLPSDIDLITYGFPCQDISLAGHQKGLFNEDGTKTRSGLFFEALRIIEDTKPKVAIAENVKNLTSKKFKEQFEIVLKSLEDAGYNNYWKVLNAKDFGVPQNRERVFIVSIRKDIDLGFEFPEGFQLELKLKDLLEDEVDEKYYLKGTVDFFIKNSFDMEAKGNGFRFSPHIKKNATIAKAITTRAGGRMDDNFVSDIELSETNFTFSSKSCVQVGNLSGGKWDKINESCRRVYSEEGLSPTIHTCQGGNTEPKVLIETPILAQTEDGFVCRNANSKGFDIAKDGDSVDFAQPNSTTRRGRVGHGVCQTLDTGSSKYAVTATISDLRIRKLTPKECFRLMGFTDEEFQRAADVPTSNTQLYKMAGNSIVVDVLVHLMRGLWLYL